MFVDSQNLVLSDLGHQCLLFVHTNKTANDEEGEGVIRTYRGLGKELVNYRALVITDGGGPSPSHRKKMQLEFGEPLKSMRTAILSDAITLRFVVASLRLFMNNIKAFEPRDVPGALSFAGLPEDAHAPVLTSLKEIGTKLPAGRFRTMDAVLGR